MSPLFFSFLWWWWQRRRSPRPLGESSARQAQQQERKYVARSSRSKTPLGSGMKFFLFSATTLTASIVKIANAQSKKSTVKRPFLLSHFSVFFFVLSSNGRRRWVTGCFRTTGLLIKEFWLAPVDRAHECITCLASRSTSNTPLYHLDHLVLSFFFLSSLNY